MKKQILKYINDWENKCYKNGIPDEAPLRLEQLNKVPSYRLIVKAILKNDVVLKLLGFNKPKCHIYSELKRIELLSKGKIKETNQLKLKI